MTPIVLGVIADTHGQLRPEVHRALAGVYLILHAGDVCGDEVLDELAVIAPVAAVAGNCDPPGHPRLPPQLVRNIGGLSFHMSHGHELGVPTPDKLLAAYEADVLIYGHTHRPLVHRAANRLVLNPGAAGPRRFDIAPTVARLTIAEGRADVQLVSLA
ncbi:MAG: metallophosphoesterase family protein [Gemmatimonadaceae bacterium]